MTARPERPRSLAAAAQPSELGPEALQEVFRRIVPDPQIFEALPLREMRDAQMYPLLAASWIARHSAAVALILSVSGLYGVLSDTLTQRTTVTDRVRLAHRASPSGFCRAMPMADLFARGQRERESSRLDQAARVGLAGAGDVERGTVIDRRAHVRQAERDVDRVAETRVLEHRQALIVIHRQHRVDAPQLQMQLNQ